MNKIHNNLTIENLMKTECFNQFNKQQQKVIILGLEQNLDISIYAKNEFEWEQMEEIREGLENNLDVSIYANSNFDFLQMTQIRLGLEDNLNLSGMLKIILIVIK